MGLITALLTLPLAPVRGVAWVAEQITDEVAREMYDESRIRSELLALELDADEGIVSEEERSAREQELLDRLSVAIARRTEQDGELPEGER
jgi:hypothetical protein